MKSRVPWLLGILLIPVIWVWVIAFAIFTCVVLTISAFIGQLTWEWKK